MNDLNWKVTVLSRDNAKGSNFTTVYFVSAANVNEAKSLARLQWLQERERLSHDASWLSCQASQITEPQPVFW